MWFIVQISLVVALAAAGAVVLWVGPILKLVPEQTGALTGGLIGAAAAMLGAMLIRLAESSDKRSSDAKRCRNLKALIDADLVTVSLGYVSLQLKILDARRTFFDGQRVDLFGDIPRSMPFASAMGAELLILSPPEIEVLSTLEGGIIQTRRTVQAISTGERKYNLLTIFEISNQIGHDISNLAHAFEIIAPFRKMVIDGQPSEVASVLLRRLAAELLANESQIQA